MFFKVKLELAVNDLTQSDNEEIICIMLLVFKKVSDCLAGHTPY